MAQEALAAMADRAPVAKAVWAELAELLAEAAEIQAMREHAVAASLVNRIRMLCRWSWR